MEKSQKQKREYDMFGPWIFEIESPDDVPGAFEPHFHYDESVELAIKIPHQIERRNARPGDNLYDHLLACSADSVAVFSLSGSGIKSWRGAYTDVVAIRTLHDLLHGELTLYTPDELFTVPFNTVSEEMIERVTTLVGSHRNGHGTAGSGAAAQGDAPTAATSVDPAKVADLYRNLIRREGRRGGAVPIAYQKTVPLEKRNKNLFDQLLDAIRRITLRPVLVLAGPAEIILYHAEPQIMRFGRGSYGYSRVEIPYSSLNGVADQKSTTFIASVDLGFSVPGHTITVEVDEEFPVKAVQAAGELAPQQR